VVSGAEYVIIHSSLKRERFRTVNMFQGVDAFRIERSLEVTSVHRSWTFAFPTFLTPEMLKIGPDHGWAVHK
jgi:hypothetical protein